jgi:hypothetical protein
MRLREREISPWIAWTRKIRVLATVARRGRGGSFSAEDFFGEVDRLKDRALVEVLPHRKIERLWQIEGLSYRYFEGNNSPESLDGRLPPEAGPPAHCGLGMAAVLNCGFDAVPVLRFIEAAADANFIPQAYESVGLMLAAYEPDTFSRLSGLLGRLGIMRRTPLVFPEPGTFLEKLQGEIRELAAHGYGRLHYFKSSRLSSVIDTARRTDFISTSGCIKGAVAAYTLINSRDLGRVLQIAEADEDPEVAESVNAGLFNTLLLLEWTAPGCLESVEPSTPRVHQIVERAAELARFTRAKKLGPPIVA